MVLSDSQNARSKSVTVADGPNTLGTLNQYPANPYSYDLGVSDDKGQRRTMEDAYSFVIDFAGVRGQGYFGIFDGHAGKEAAEWCGNHFHEILLEEVQSNPNDKIPEILNKTFHSVDAKLSKQSEENDTHSGCTAVTAFLRIEDEQGEQSFLPADHLTRSPPSSNSNLEEESTPASGEERKSGSRIRQAVKSLAGRVGSPSSSLNGQEKQPPPFEPQYPEQLRKVLYTANAGDARAVLSRGGKAVRLTYDHKGSDKQEARRIMDAGGFVMNNRVNGVLAVTRSLGDSSMKEFVVGAPYTTATELGEEDEFLIIACDGLWDVTEDQQAVELVRNIKDAKEASKVLLDHALNNFSSDNITVLVVRFKGHNK